MKALKVTLLIGITMSSLYVNSQSSTSSANNKNNQPASTVRDHRNPSNPNQPDKSESFEVISAKRTDNKDKASEGGWLSNTLAKAQTKHPANLKGFETNNLINKGTVKFTDFIFSENKSQVILTDVIKLEHFIYSTKSQESPTQLLLLADTLIISGNNKLDFSENKLRVNGYLSIFCRVLKFSQNGKLTIKLNNGSQKQYRQFVLLTEEVIINNEKGFNTTQIIKERIMQENSSPQENEQIVVPTKSGKIQQNGAIIVSTKASYLSKEKFLQSYLKTPQSTFYVNICPNLLEAARVIPQSEEWVCKWIVGLYGRIENDMRNQNIRMDRLMFAKKYMRVMQFQKYSLPMMNNELAHLQRSIIKLRDETLGSNNSFERKITINGEEYAFITSLTLNGLENFCIPDILLVNPIGTVNNLMLGYYIFNNKNPVDIGLEFDVALTSSTKKYTELSSYLAHQNEKISMLSDQLIFDNLYLSGSDIISQKCKITEISGNQYKIKLTTSTAQSPLFSKLFGQFPSDIQIKGSWKMRGNENLNGKLNIPILLSKIKLLNKMEDYTAGRKGLLLKNEEFSDNNSSRLGVSLLKKILLPEFADKLNSARATNNVIELQLDPAKANSYFEQIDESDRLTQDVIISNIIPATPADSISGHLLFVELTLAFEQQNKEGQSESINQKSLKLSPAPSIGSNANIEIMKSGTDYIPIAIGGVAYYENGRYNLKPQKLPAGELVVKITPDMLSTSVDK
ncbi:MAG: hypothetical protein U0X91_05595 [Spirosomataceae bacterium]